MKNLKLNKPIQLISLFLMTLVFSFNANALIADRCAKTGDAITTVSGPSGSPVIEGTNPSDTCSDTPDFYKFKFYKMGLCTADPSGNDLSSCQYIMNDATGVDHALAYPSTGEMDIPQFSIAPGTYPFMVTVISNKLSIKHSITTTNNVSGNTGEGKYCWTSNAGPIALNNEVIISDASAHNVTTILASSDQFVECGTTAGTAIYTDIIIGRFADGACSVTWGTDGDKVYMGAAGNSTSVASVLKDDGTFATACTNSAKILWTSTLNTPAVVTSDSIFELKMRSQDSVALLFSNGSNNDMSRISPEAPQLYLTVN